MSSVSAPSARVCWRLLCCGLAFAVLALLPGSDGLAAERAARKRKKPAPVAQVPVTTHHDLTYSTTDREELQLDLAVPAAGEGPYPLLVFIHGGGWAGGNRQSFRSQIQNAARRGYVAATVSYRLMQFDQEKKETTTAKKVFPAQVHDAKAAIRWLRANAAEYHADPERIGVIGFSAGGQLALMLGLTDEDSGLEGNGGNPKVSSRVQAVVNVSGPTEMKSAWRQSSLDWILRLYMGGTPEEAAEHYRLASPVTWVSQDDPPVLTIHGDQDRVVPVSNARLLDEKLKEVGGSHRLVVLKGQGHGLRGNGQRTMVREALGFFDRQLKQPAAAAAGE